MFDLFEIVFLIPIFIIGAFSVFTDLKWGKIYNKVISFGFLYGFLAFAFFAFKDFNGDYLLNAFINLAIAVLVSYLLWFYHCWSAGDAKLFSLFVFLLPLNFYANSNYAFFPSFNILVNLFILVIFVLFLLSIFNLFKRKVQKMRIKSLMNFLISFFKLFFTYVFLFFLFNQLSGLMPRQIMDSEFLYLFYIIFIFVSYRFIYAFLKKHFLINYMIIFSTLCYSFYLVFLGEAQLLKLVYARAFLFLFCLTLLRVSINNYLDHYDFREILIKELKKGMIISKNNPKKYRIKSGSGLSEEDVRQLQESFKEDECIKIHSDFKFAVYMYFAVIATIVLKGSFLSLVL